MIIPRSRRAAVVGTVLTTALATALALASGSPAGAAADRMPPAAPRPAGCPGSWLGLYPNAEPSISDDGRFVVWEGYAEQDNIDTRNILLRDLKKGATVTLTRAGNGVSYYQPSISGDGDRVVYYSPLVGDPDEVANTVGLYVYDRRTGRTSYEGTARTSSTPLISRDGRTIVFERGDGAFAATTDVIARNVDTDAEAVVSISRIPAGNRFSYPAGLSADGRYLLFSSLAYLPPAGSDAGTFVRDLKKGTTTEVLNQAGDPLAAGSGPLLSPDGRYVTYPDAGIRVRNLKTGRTVLASAAPSETYHVGGAAGISAKGRQVVYSVSYLIGDESSGDAFTPVLVRDVRAGTDTVASAGPDGQLQPWTGSYPGGITPDGRFVVFYSDATNLPGDPDSVLDVFVRDLKQRTTTLVSTSDAGSACP